MAFYCILMKKTTRGIPEWNFCINNYKKSLDLKQNMQNLKFCCFTNNYGSLSTKAMRKIYPFIKENDYSDACKLAGYNHSENSLNKEELANRTLGCNRVLILYQKTVFEPVVEKDLN